MDRSFRTESSEGRLTTKAWLHRQSAATIGQAVEELQQRIDALPRDQLHRRTFITTYQRATQAVGDAVDAAFFEDPDWVVRWDVAFANLFLVAHDAHQMGRHVPRPWRLAFQAEPALPTVVHLPLGIRRGKDRRLDETWPGAAGLALTGFGVKLPPPESRGG